VLSHREEAGVSRDGRAPRAPFGGFRFPWREGNGFELLNDGAQFYPRMLAAIEGARRYVLLEIYLFESGAVANRFIEAFRVAAARGVEVRLLLDDFGARGLRAPERARLAVKGIEVVYYNRLRCSKLLRNFARDHRKLLLVDGEVAFVGGAGITDEFDPPGRSAQRWREIMLEIRGPVVGDWLGLFNEVWRRHADDVTGFVPVPNGSLRDGMRARVTVTRAPRELEIPRALMKRVRGAKVRAWIMTAYFVPSRRLRRVLREAARRGVDVRVLVPGPITDHPAVRHAGRRYYTRLLASGVRIFEYQPRFLHGKAAFVDEWATLGSSNFDRWNLRWSLEANQEIEDARFAARVQAMFEADFADSVECRAERWAQRPWRERLRERFWGGVDRWLHRLGRGREDET
jgi:phosphatidylserine/phosphatidylglycerophosphate/cardiolipin synthase-like enzyme